MVKRRIPMAISLLAIALASIGVNGIYPSPHIEEVIPGDRQLTSCSYHSTTILGSRGLMVETIS